MSIAPDFCSRLRALVELQGAALTADELAHVWGNFPKCRGQEPWHVREYVGRIGAGAREYRVVRGSESQDVYRSAARVRAAAVGMALNELEAQETARGSAEGGRIADRHE
jgi:hypothetical protein